RAVTKVRSAPAALAAPLASAAATVRRRSRRWWWLPGWVVTAITEVPALLVLPVLIIFAPLALALCYFTMRQLPVRWREAAPSPEAGEPAERRRPEVPALAVLATVAIAAGFGVWQAVCRSEQVIVVSDPGVYLQYGYWIAMHGSARIPETSAAFGTVPGLSFASPGFFPDGGSITPAFMPGLPL